VYLTSDAMGNKVPCWKQEGEGDAPKFYTEKNAPTINIEEIDQLNKVQLRSVVKRLSRQNNDSVRKAISSLMLNTNEFLGPEMCSITFEQLNNIALDAKTKFGQKEYEKMTMHDINREIIKPRCNITKKPYSLYLNPEGLEIDVFCTHTWSDSFSEFVHAIGQAYSSHDDKPNLWICAFALFQGNEKEVEQQLEQPLSEAPFVRALSQASTFLVVQNSTVDLYSRIWCVCELVLAKKFNLVPDKTLVVGPDEFSNCMTSVEKAQSFCQRDRERILQYLLELHGSYKEIDDIVSKFRTQKPSANSSIKVKSQKEVSERYMKSMIDSAVKYRKKTTSYIRKGVKGEHVTTVLFGAKETEKTIPDDDHYVVCGQGAFETYSITKQEFLENYAAESSTQISNKLTPYQNLNKNGFQEYRSRRMILVHKLNSEDMNWFRSGMGEEHNNSDMIHFFAPWDEQIVAKEGDFLATTYPPDGRAEVYRIEQSAFEFTYEPL